MKLQKHIQIPKKHIFHRIPGVENEGLLVGSISGEEKPQQNVGVVRGNTSAVQTVVDDLLSQRPPYSFIDALSYELRAHDKQLFINTHVDARTGLLRRSGLNMFKRMLESGQATSIAFLDGDHFGVINEVCGKTFADAQITVMGEELASATEALRAQGHDVYAVLWGGEEFIIFGDVSKEVLTKALTTAAAKIKERIRAAIPEEEKAEIAARVFAKRYASLDDGLERATAEIGGITGGVTAALFRECKPEYARNTVTYVDGLLCEGKDTHGRGTMYCDTHNVPSTSEKIQEFTEENKLSAEQNRGFHALAKNLEKKIAERFSQKTPQARGLLERFRANEEATHLLTEFFKTPPFSLSDAKEIATQLSLSVGELRIAKLEVMQAEYTHGTYTGAATMNYLNSLNESFSVGGKIDVREFKSINDVAGHTNGDTYLMWFYNEVILSSIADCGLTTNDIVVAQHGAGFPFKIKNGDAEIMLKFEASLQKIYSEKSAQLGRDIDPENPTFLDTVRIAYIRKDHSQPAEPRLSHLNTVLISLTP